MGDIAIPSTIAFSVVSQWFRDRAGIATGLVTLGAALGGIFFSLVLQALFANLQWKAASLVLTAILACSLLLGNLLVETNAVEHTAHEDERREGPKLSGMLRSPKFWLASYAIFGECSRFLGQAV